MTKTRTPNEAEYVHALARTLWQAECIALARIIGTSAEGSPSGKDIK